jgi:hypothetical protein
VNASKTIAAALAATFAVLGWAFVLEMAWNFVFPGHPISYPKSLVVWLLIQLVRIA